MVTVEGTRNVQSRPALIGATHTPVTERSSPLQRYGYPALARDSAPDSGKSQRVTNLSIRHALTLTSPSYPLAEVSSGYLSPATAL